MGWGFYLGLGLFVLVKFLHKPSDFFGLAGNFICI